MILRMSYLQPLLVILSGWQVFDAFLQTGVDPGAQGRPILAGKLEDLLLDKFWVNIRQQVNEVFHLGLDIEMPEFGLGVEVRGAVCVRACHFLVDLYKNLSNDLDQT